MNPPGLIELFQTELKSTCADNAYPLWRGTDALQARLQSGACQSGCLLAFMLSIGQLASVGSPSYEGNWQRIVQVEPALRPSLGQSEISRTHAVSPTSFKGTQGAAVVVVVLVVVLVTDVVEVELVEVEVVVALELVELVEDVVVKVEMEGSCVVRDVELDVVPVDVLVEVMVVYAQPDRASSGRHDAFVMHRTEGVPENNREHDHAADSHTGNDMSVCS